MAPRLRLDPILIQAVIAGSLSFAHLHDIAAAAGQDGWKAWAYPVSVDLLLVAAWRRMRVLRSTDRPARAAWTWFIIALAASLGANVATAGLLDLGAVPAWLRILVAGWPAAAFLGGTLLAHAPSLDTPAPAPAPRPPVETVEREPAAPASAEPAAVPSADAAPALPAASPSAGSAMEVPAALLAHARKLAADHTARTGSPLDLDGLRAVLGVPAPLAAAIAAQL